MPLCVPVPVLSLGPNCFLSCSHSVGGLSQPFSTLNWQNTSLLGRKEWFEGGVNHFSTKVLSKFSHIDPENAFLIDAHFQTMPTTASDSVAYLLMGSSSLNFTSVSRVVNRYVRSLRLPPLKYQSSGWECSSEVLIFHGQLIGRKSLPGNEISSHLDFEIILLYLQGQLDFIADITEYLFPRYLRRVSHWLHPYSCELITYDWPACVLLAISIVLPSALSPEDTSEKRKERMKQMWLILIKLEWVTPCSVNA